MMMNKLLLLLLFPVITYSQHLTLEFGANSTGGNNKSLTWFTNSTVAKDDSIFGYKVYGEFDYTKADEKLNIDRLYILQGNFDFYVIKNTFGFLYFDAEKNTVRKINSKYNFGVGAKYIIIPKYHDVSLGVIYDNVNYDKIVISNYKKEFTRFSLRLRDKFNIAENCNLENVILYQPQINDFQNYIINVTASASYKLTTVISIINKFQLLYDNFKIQSIENYDWTFSTGVNLNF